MKNSVVKNKRVLRIAAITAGCCLLPALVLYLLPKLFPMRMEKGRISGEQASYISAVTYETFMYTQVRAADETTYVLGDRLGTVQFNSIGYEGPYEAFSISSTTLHAGDPIYEWEGYDSLFRICGVDSSGMVHGFERNAIESRFEICFIDRFSHAIDTLDRTITGWFRPRDESSDGSILKWFPDAEKIVSIRICDDNPMELGRIDSAEQIREFVRLFKEATVYPDQFDRAAMGLEVKQRIYLTLQDGSETQIILFNKNLGHWKGYVAIPEGLWDLITSDTLYEAGAENLNYGALCAEIDYAGEAFLEIQDQYVMAPVWAADGELRIGRYYPGDEYYVLANDAQGFIRIEGTDIWYLTDAGNVSHLRFQYPACEADFIEKLAAGADLSAYVTLREMLYEGPFVSLQVRNGVVWTLDAQGFLSRDGAIVETDVTCFALDAEGVTYGCDDGLFRERKGSASAKQLTQTAVKAVAAAGINVYYATADGEIRKIQIDGDKDCAIRSLAAASLQYSPFDVGELAITGEDGKAYLLFGDAELFCIAEGVDKTECAYQVSSVFLRRNGAMEWCSFIYEAGRELHVWDTTILPTP